MFEFFKEEAKVIQDRDPAIKTPMEVVLYPSFRAIVYYRLAHKLYKKQHYFLARAVSQYAHGHRDPSRRYDRQRSVY